MDTKSVIRIIKEFKEALESNNIHVAKIILFGSYAKGLSQFGSDIDLIVTSESFKKKTIFHVQT
jgi:predicted nucleotidyltransferase